MRGGGAGSSESAHPGRSGDAGARVDRPVRPSAGAIALRTIGRRQRVADLRVGPRLGEDDAADRAVGEDQRTAAVARSIAARSSRIVALDLASCRRCRDPAPCRRRRRPPAWIVEGAAARVARASRRRLRAPGRRSAKVSAGAVEAGHVAGARRRASGRRGSGPRRSRPVRRRTAMPDRPAPATTWAFVTDVLAVDRRSRSRSTRSRRSPPVTLTTLAIAWRGEPLGRRVVGQLDRGRRAAARSRRTRSGSPVVSSSRAELAGDLASAAAGAGEGPDHDRRLGLAGSVGHRTGRRAGRPSARR